MNMNISKPDVRDKTENVRTINVGTINVGTINVGTINVGTNTRVELPLQMYWQRRPRYEINGDCIYSALKTKLCFLLLTS
jgi:hypothetical protein